MSQPAVWIYEVQKEWSSHAWLCDACRARWVSAGWTIRSRRLPPPRVLGVQPATATLGERCHADLDDREPIACQGCHLAALAACPTCRGPVVFPGAIGLEPCHDGAHERT